MFMGSNDDISGYKKVSFMKFIDYAVKNNN